MTRTYWIYAAAVTLPLALALPASPVLADVAAPAAVTAQTPTQFIQAIAETALNSINGKKLSDEETMQRFRDLLNQGFDLKAIGRFVLGPYYNSATPEQRTEYQAAFENMIVKAYALRFRDYSGASFKAGREIPNGKDTEVDSQIVPHTGAPPINVAWKIRSESGQFKIIDVAVEGVSMGNTQKSEFSSVIERNGGKIDALISALKNNKIGLAADSNNQ